MSNDSDRSAREVDMDEVIAAIEAAESQALADHAAGTCHLSEWSCSHCEAGQ